MNFCSNTWALFLNAFLHRQHLYELYVKSSPQNILQFFFTIPKYVIVNQKKENLMVLVLLVTLLLFILATQYISQTDNYKCLTFETDKGALKCCQLPVFYGQPVKTRHFSTYP